MQPRHAISNFIITVVLLFFMFIIGLLLKARYRLPSEKRADEIAERNDPVPRAIPVGQRINEPRAYKSGAFWVLQHPQLVVSRSNDADTLRIKSGPKEDVFVLYSADAVQSSWTHPKRIAEHAVSFGRIPEPRVLSGGAQALAAGTNLLQTHPFIVYTKYARVPDTERFYAFIRVEMDGRQMDLGEWLVRQGYATPTGVAPDAMPEAGRTPAEYLKDLQRALTQAKAATSGLWAAK